MTDTFTHEVARMAGPEAMPRANGELRFDAPWQGRAVAVAVALVDRLGIDWDDFRQRLIAAIAQDPQRPYYDSWANALEALVIDHGLTDEPALGAATPTERVPL